MNPSNSHAPTGWFGSVVPESEPNAFTRRARHMNERCRQQLGHNDFDRLYNVDLELVILRHGELCFYCGREISFSDDPPSGTFDHVRPVSRGGRNVWQNVVPCCEPCNLKKTDRRLAYRGGRLVMLWPDQV